MASNFEAKHPRAIDGKFTEKVRAESGLILDLGDCPRENEAEDLERGEIFIGKTLHHIDILGARYSTLYRHEKYDKIPPGQWQLAEKTTMKDGTAELTYHHREGIVVETFDKEGRIEKQVFKEKSGLPLEDANKWTERNWNKDGVLVSRKKWFFPQPTKEGRFKTISEAIDKAGRRLVVSESFYDNGVIEGYRAWFKKGGQLYQTSTVYDKEGSIGGTSVHDFNDKACAPENTPSFEFYQDGKVSRAEYKVDRGGKPVYHRTDGPAIIDKSAPEGQRERYFLEGREYTKAEWEKKVGK